MLSIDPGLDGIGIALWHAGHYREHQRTVRPDMAAALKALVGSLTITTAASDPLEVRLAEIGGEMLELVQDHRPALAYVEQPAIDGGQYREKRNAGGGTKNAAAVAKLHMGIGAILSALGMLVPVVLLRAGQERKAERRAVLELNAKIAGLRLPEGPRGGKREDEVDALWVGAYALTTRLEADLRELERPAAANS